MNFLDNRKFVTVVFSDTTLRGGLFERKGNRVSLVKSAEIQITEGRDAAWRKMVKALDFNSTVPMFVGGSVSGTTFFRTNSVAMDTQSRRSALEMELGRHLLGQVPEHKLQFVPLAEHADGKLPVNVCVVPESLFKLLASAFSSCSRRADNFVYPLLALKEDDPAIYIPELEKDYEFSSGQWKRVDENRLEENRRKWAEIFSSTFTLPADFDTAAYAAVLLIARLVSSDEFGNLRDGIKVLPDNLRPVRYRKKLISAAVLAFLLVVNLAWGWYLKWSKDSSGYRETVSKAASLDRETKKIKALLRKDSRIHKERLRVVASKPGEADILTDLAEFSRLLPGAAMVTNYRRNETDIDIVISSEDENINYPQVLKPIAHKWRVGQIQQRQRGNSTSINVNLKLVPAETEKAIAKKVRKK